ncbi:Dynamin family protein [Kytococcus aerolatus]|uniref:Dynamin family protein n=1 Tax=Kytococcus aerolatus TaxID=592308 RepID=A0A212U0B5_9MICO|nr:ABC transporter [Kytococcus aerolatus]SNC71571.1 Dynamin family protein [Kytococcus aerolatus]
MTDRLDPALIDAVSELRGAVADARFPLETPDAQEVRDQRGQLLRQLDDYALPRLRDLDAPLLCVVGGSTGAGKSTLVNSLLGDVLTTSGVLRPTTRASVLIHHPADAGWFTTDRVLPELARLTGGPAGLGDASAVRLVESRALRPGLALLDAPDIDSVVEANRDLARQLLGAADLWIFVTTAARYADAVPWQMLLQAAERGTSVALVLDRVPAGAMDEVLTDFSAMLREQGLGDAPVFAVPESQLTEDGLLPPEEVGDVRGWLHNLADDADARQVVIRRTLAGTLASLDRRSHAVAQGVDSQVAVLDALREDARLGHADARERVEESMSDGTLLRGEVLARWQELVGTGEIFKQLDAGVGRLRDRVAGFFTGRRPTAATEDLGEALEEGVAQLLESQLEAAAAVTARAWRADPAGAALLERHPELSRPGAGVRERTQALVHDWQSDLLEMVRRQAGSKRTTARYLAIGVNGLGVLLMLLAFASTGGALLGSEVAIAGGSAVVAQRILEAIFGDQAVRSLAAAARVRLMERVEDLLAQERGRFDAVLDEVGVSAQVAQRLREAAARVEAHR